MVEKQGGRMFRRIDIKADNIAQLGGKLRVTGKLEQAIATRLEAMAGPNALHRTDAVPLAAMSAAVQWVVSPGGAICVSAQPAR